MHLLIIQIIEDNTSNAIWKTLFVYNNTLNFKKRYFLRPKICAKDPQTTLNIRFHLLQFESVLNFSDAMRYE